MVINIGNLLKGMLVSVSSVALARHFLILTPQQEKTAGVAKGAIHRISQPSPVKSEQKRLDIVVPRFPEGAIDDYCNLVVDDLMKKGWSHKEATQVVERFS